MSKRSRGPLWRKNRRRRRHARRAHANTVNTRLIQVIVGFGAVAAYVMRQWQLTRQASPPPAADLG